MSETLSRKPGCLAALARLDAHHRFFISFAVALFCYITFFGHLQWVEHLILSWDVFSLCVLVFSWATIFAAKPGVVLKNARLQHEGRMGIFLFVLASACASLGAVFFLLPLAKKQSTAMAGGHIALALGTVLLAWALIHTIFALHYAYLYYCRHGKTTVLLFPDGKVEPDYCDFAYFSFVIGMTCQVSDVQIASPQIRRWALLHGLIAFAFNTAVLALGINIASGLFDV